LFAVTVYRLASVSGNLVKVIVWGDDFELPVLIWHIPFFCDL